MKKARGTSSWGVEIKLGGKKPLQTMHKIITLLKTLACSETILCISSVEKVSLYCEKDFPPEILILGKHDLTWNKAVTYI